jgi:hypothetical protein
MWNGTLRLQGIYGKKALEMCIKDDRNPLSIFIHSPIADQYLEQQMPLSL